MKALRALALAVVLLASRGHAQEAPESLPASEPPDGTALQPAPAEEVLLSEPLPEPAAPEPEIALSQAELELLGLEPSRAAIDKSFHFYGFADFTSSFPIRNNIANVALGRKHSFYVGNVNLYLTRNLSERFRTFGEVRLTYLPNGGIEPTNYTLNFVDTRILDYADNSRATKWGGVIMQRLYLEWTLHRFVTVRMGQFLTPFGIWNVDHGSPAYIPVIRPYVLNSQSTFFPERQTGLELLGRWDVANDATLGYDVTISNGGGSVSEYRDFDKNKALGARVYLEHHGAGYLRVGSSGYYGRDTTASLSPSVGTDSVSVVEKVGRQFDVLSIAGDLLYKVGALHLQLELATQQRRYTRAGRAPHPVYFAPAPTAFPQDYLTYAGYLLAAYELPWLALTPYLEAQHARDIFDIGFAGYLCRVWVLQGGLNVHPIDEVVFKLEYAHSWFPDGGPLFREPFGMLQLQAAWAF